MTLEDVGGLAMHEILSKLGAKNTAAMACVSRRFRCWATDDSLWAKFCSDDLQISSPVDPRDNPLPSFLVCYQIWREAFGMYPWPLVLRVKRCWNNIKDWLSVNFPEVLPTLRKGASENEIRELEKSLKVRLPIGTRVLYRFCDGQEILNVNGAANEISNSLNLTGLIGGYSFFDHIVNVFLFSLRQMIRRTRYMRRDLDFGLKSKYVIVAASMLEQKFFFLNCSDGQLYVGTRSFVSEGETLPCVPKDLISSVHYVGGAEPQDAMLLWLEEHGRRLQSGLVKVREENGTKSINLFPEEPPFCSTAVTNGVKVRASAVLAPELCILQDDSQKYLFSYSIRMSLMPEGCKINGMSFNSCQLYWRHWIIGANDAVVSDVNGEAVIGKFPLLHSGEEEFVYEGCIPLPSCGSIEGAFTFVPGSLADAKDSPFQVEVARFPLQLPDYIF